MGEDSSMVAPGNTFITKLPHVILELVEAPRFLLLMVLPSWKYGRGISEKLRLRVATGDSSVCEFYTTP